DRRSEWSGERYVREPAVIRVITALLVAAALAAPPVVHATATITVGNKDGAREGFNDTTPVAPGGGNPGTARGAERLNGIQHAADIWGALLDSTIEIRVGSTFDSLPCSTMGAVLGQAGAHAAIRDFAGAPVASTWYAIALANSLAGLDLDPG